MLGSWIPLGLLALMTTFVASKLEKRASLSLSKMANYSTEYWIDLPIDHTNPSLGTFKSRYFFSDKYWQGPGSPIVLVNVGEQTADGFYSLLTGPFIQHVIMKNLGAAGIVMEHRYFGKSSPYPDLTAEHLQWMTADQVVQDHVERYSDVFAAGWATSAPVQAQGDFWQYWEPVEEGMPKNCTSDLAASVNYIDGVLANGTPDQVTALKASFGLEALQNDDFAASLVIPFTEWQDLKASTFATQGQSDIYQMCDLIETKADNTTNTEATGIGLPLALQNWAAIWKNLLVDPSTCPGGSCRSTYNYTTDPTYTNNSVSDDRGWSWLICTDFGWFQVGNPGNKSSIVSGFNDVASWERRCNHQFPNADGTPGNYSAAGANSTNAEYKGWNIVAQNLFVVNGQYDPWRSASLSSGWAPSTTNTTTQEISVIPGAHHCWDFYLDDTVFNADVQATQQLGLTTLYGWLQNWYKARPNITNHLPATAEEVADFNSTLLATLNTVTGDPTSEIDKLRDEINHLLS
ncbi:hypothetical protein FRB99_002838, partial [Tulasnella sp. 403]